MMLSWSTMELLWNIVILSWSTHDLIMIYRGFIMITSWLYHNKTMMISWETHDFIFGHDQIMIWSW